jgi:DNA polymerase
MNDSSTKARLTLLLRSERAMGLHSTTASRAAIAALKKPADSHPQALIGKPALPRAVAPPPKPIVRAPIPAPATTPLFVEAPLPVEEILSTPELSRDKKIAALAELNAKEVSICKKCRLCEARTQTVFGEGDPNAKIVFIGEGPGETEDQTGRPFVGRAGALLEKMIIGMGLTREQVFICNIVKCRPPGNRTPAPDEVATCTPYLVKQLSIIKPKVIVTLGLPASKYMLNSSLSMGRLRGQWTQWRGIKLMPTYHPAFLLRAYTPENRAAVWSDLKQVMTEVGLKGKS